VSVGNRLYPGCEFDVEALVDTGFDGGLAVPPGLIPDHARAVGETFCILADGSSLRARSYVGFVSVGSLLPIDAIIMEIPGEALLGRAVTNRYRLSFVYGRQVMLET
jgi:predicted aspartyl protease